MLSVQRNNDGVKLARQPPRQGMLHAHGQHSGVTSVSVIASTVLLCVAAETRQSPAVCGRRALSQSHTTDATNSARRSISRPSSTNTQPCRDGSGCTKLIDFAEPRSHLLDVYGCTYGLLATPQQRLEYFMGLNTKRSGWSQLRGPPLRQKFFTSAAP